MRRILFLLSLCVFFQGNILAQNAKPKVIPELQKWQGGEGFFEFSLKTKLSVHNNHKALQPYIDQFSKEISEEYHLQTGKSNIVQFSIGAKHLPDEGYIIDIKSNKIEVVAPNHKGVFWATRTLLQMFENGGMKLPVGKIEDYPDYPNRGFMLDTGRKFFTMDYLEKYVKLLSYYKFNEFQIHLNDNGFPVFFNNDWNKTYSAFRLESETYPGLTAKDGHYTKEQFRNLQKMGMLYGVNVIPEIDIPAHSLAFAHYMPELGSDKYGKDHLDLYNPKTYEFVDALYKEYISGNNPTFIGPDVHIGTDEYDKKETEKYREFTDKYLKYIQKLGKNVRMWGSLRWMKGNTPVTSDNVIVNAWSHDWTDPFQSEKEGYKIINTCDSWLYIVPAAGYYRDFLDEKWLYETWKVEQINSKETMPDGSKALLGAMFAVWNDHVGNGISQQDVHYRTLPAMKVLSQKMWKKKTDIPFDEFKKLADGMNECPTVNILGRLEKGKTHIFDLITKPNNITMDNNQKMAILSNNTYIETPISDISYNYTIAFDLNLSSHTKDESILFSSDYSKVFVVKQKLGYRIAFARDGYNYQFSTLIPYDTWTNIEITADYKSTSLSVLGKKEILGAIKQEFINSKNNRKSYMYYQQTLMFPMKYIGGKDNNSFDGKIKNITVIK